MKMLLCMGVNKSAAGQGMGPDRPTYCSTTVFITVHTQNVNLAAHIN